MILANPTMPSLQTTREATNGDTVRLPNVENAEVIVAEILKKHRESNFSKWTMLGNSYLNLAFFLGRQWTHYNAANMQVEECNNPDNEIRIVANKIQPITRDVISLLDSGHTQMEVVPATRQTADKQFAAVSEAALDYCDRVIDDSRLKRESDQLRVMDGTACIRYWVDPRGGQKVQVPQMGPMGPQLVPMQEPEIRGEVYSIDDFHVFPVNPKSPRNITGVMFTTWRPVEEVREQFPQFASQIFPVDDMEVSEWQSRKKEWLMSPQALGFNGVGSAHRGMVRVYEYLELPTEARPQGRKITVVNKVLVQNDPNPFVGLFPSEVPRHLQLGCVFIRGVEVPGKFWGIGVPEILRPMQIQLNRIKSDQANNRLAMGRNRIFGPPGALARGEDSLTNIHGAYVALNPQYGSNPFQILPAVALPGVGEEIMETQRDMDDASGRPAVTRGVNDTQVRSGDQLSMLQDAANMKFGPLAKERELADGDGARIRLALIKVSYSPMKLLRICGEQKGYALTIMRSENLYSDVTVVEGSALPRNRAAWNQMIGGLWQQGAIVDDQGRPDPRQLRRNLDIGGFVFEGREQVHIDRAQTENANFQQGQMANVAPWDNHILHIEEHDYFLAENPNLPPQVVQMVLFHIQQHAMTLVQNATPPPGSLPAPQEPQPAGASA